MSISSLRKEEVLLELFRFFAGKFLFVYLIDYSIGNKSNSKCRRSRSMEKRPVLLVYNQQRSFVFVEVHRKYVEMLRESKRKIDWNGCALFQSYIF